MEEVKMEVGNTNITSNTTVYCHFSFKRPNKGVDGYGLFAVAFYRNGIIGKNRKQLRAEVVARSKQDRKEELEFLGIEE